MLNTVLGQSCCNTDPVTECNVRELLGWANPVVTLTLFLSVLLGSNWAGPILL